MIRRVPNEALLLLSLVLLLCNAWVGVELTKEAERAELSVSFLDVGQGDAILIEGPTGIQLLVDGGRDREVVRALPRALGPLDRSIDAVLATHPDADHIGGLPDVLARYRVSHVLLPARGTDSPQAARLADAIAREEGAAGSIAVRGQRIHLGEGAYADILYPGTDAGTLRETNDASVIMRVVYGESEFFLSGDAPTWAEDLVVGHYGSALQSDVLKAGHHGSRTSTGDALLSAVRPSYVIVSAGKDNAYGHPHEEVLARARAAGAEIRSTADEGTITFVTDGTTLRLVHP